MEQDCGFTRDSIRSCYRAAIIIIEKDCVLLASNESADYFYSVSGGIHHDETAKDTVKREVLRKLELRTKLRD